MSGSLHLQGVRFAAGRVSLKRRGSHACRLAILPAMHDASEAQRYEAGLAALERLRGTVDDEVLDVAVAAVRERMASLLQADVQQQQRLRLVSVLFVDVVGSTALGGKLDPEDIFLVMDTALERYSALISRHGGRVLQYAGDSVLAAFGADEAREEDAENAIAAGLAIINETRTLADRVRRLHQHPGFNVRVGVHSGPVLLGGGVDAANTIRGATVNMAARMEQSAPPGHLRVSLDTWRLAEGMFDGVEQPPLQVKGHAEPLRTFLVERRRPQRLAEARRGVAGVVTPMVGRDAAMTTLQEAWNRLPEPGHGTRIVTVSAVAGLGKTRLLTELEAWSRELPNPARWLQARARAQQSQLPHALLRTLLADALQLPDSSATLSAQEEREQFVAAAMPLLQAFGDAATAEAEVLGHLLGLDFSASPHLRGIVQQGAQIRQRGWRALRLLLQALASQQRAPLVLLLEDLHLADLPSLQFLCSVAAETTAETDRLPALILAAARPELHERFSGWAAASSLNLQLQPLAVADSEQLAARLLAPLSPPAPVVQRLMVERADGNPFYMEALLQMLLDQRVLEPAGGEPLQWRLQEDRLDAARIPHSLNGVLQARIGTLAAHESLALQQAAVLGVQFDADALAALDPAAPDQLPALAARGLLQPQAPDAGQAAVAEYRFSSGLLQQVAYERLLRRPRQQLHGAAARWYEALRTSRAAEWLPVAAEHYDRADEPLASARCSLAAAANLATRFAHDAVVDQASRALERMDGSDAASRWQALLLRQKALRRAGQRDAQALDLQAMDELAERSGDALQLATVALRRMVAADETGHSQQAVQLAPKALQATQQAGDTVLELTAYVAWAGALRSCGQHARAREVAEQGLARARAVGNPDLESELLVALAAICTEQADPVASERLLRQAIAVQRERGDVARECVSQINLGVVALQLGALEQAEAEFGRAFKLIERIGNRNLEVSILLNRSTTRQELGHHDDANVDADAAAALAHKIRNPELEAFALLAVGGAKLAAAKSRQAAESSVLLDAAEAAFTRCDGLLSGLGLSHLAVEAVAGLAAVAQQRGGAPLARPHVERVMEHLARVGNLDGTERPLLIRWVCLQVLHALRDPRHDTMLQASLAELQQQARRLPDAAARERFIDAHPHHRALRDHARSVGLALQA